MTVTVGKVRRADRRRPGVAPGLPRCYTRSVPTTRPRYTVTDTGETAELLDLAQRVWPDVEDRRQLLLLLTKAGGRAAAAQLADREARHERQRLGLMRAAELVDIDDLLGDGAWS